jgi:hypothetical protein
MAAPLGPRRRSDPQPEPVGARSRTAAQSHLDARLGRLLAYTAALEAALAAVPPDARRAQLEGQLAQVRRDIRTAARTRLQRRPGAVRPTDRGPTSDTAGGTAAAPGDGRS